MEQTVSINISASPTIGWRFCGLTKRQLHMAPVRRENKRSELKNLSTVNIESSHRIEQQVGGQIEADFQPEVWIVLGIIVFQITNQRGRISTSWFRPPDVMPDQLDTRRRAGCSTEMLDDDHCPSETSSQGKTMLMSISHYASIIYRYT